MKYCLLINLFLFSAKIFCQQSIDYTVLESGPKSSSLVRFKMRVPVGKTQIHSISSEKIISIHGRYNAKNSKTDLKEQNRYYQPENKSIVNRSFPLSEGKLISEVELPSVISKDFHLRVEKIVEFIVMNNNEKYQQYLQKSPNGEVRYSVIELKGINENVYDFWDVQLKEGKQYMLDVEFGLGKSTFNLSDIGIKKLSIHTAGSDVDILYSGNPNLIPMDTMDISVGMANLNIHSAEKARAKNIYLDAGFGNVLLYFNKKLTNPCKVDARLGAGKMKVLLPSEPTPILVCLKGTFFSSYKLPPGFIQLKQPGMFINESFQHNAPNLLIFEIDISMGSIEFVMSK